ncbi:hypothetical protein BpHYR1_027122 [Brachionus plicatilis]|uniref:Uncharacterized protein n=1 Tax=Brachionus plicatilis TaxID=10195 RepID=A0A3M7QZA3_BRAPC|nr:hypothetical protein BpHYR1_027122 [Brachionus plicatilis]
MFKKNEIEISINLFLIPLVILMIEMWLCEFKKKKNLNLINMRTGKSKLALRIVYADGFNLSFKPTLCKYSLECYTIYRTNYALTEKKKWDYKL